MTIAWNYSPNHTISFFVLGSSGLHVIRANGHPSSDLWAQVCIIWDVAHAAAQQLDCYGLTTHDQGLLHSCIVNVTWSV